MRDSYNFEDFTETEYRMLIRMAKEHWTLIPYDRYKDSGRICLWRHDIDFSIHRAYRMAVIEREECVRATYFIHLHSFFYNPLENELADKVYQIISLGHDIGLHFDIAFYHNILRARGLDVSLDCLRPFLTMEKDLIERTFMCPIRSFSLHNPDFRAVSWIDDDMVCGMINTYSLYLREHFAYVSDSNGYWRFQRLKEVLQNGSDEKLHVLTHPGWWTPEVMIPRERITRCINGRAAKQHQLYDALLTEHGRKNIREA
jgi:hypothetical protein